MSHASNEERAIDLAIGVMEARDWLDGEHVSNELLATLRRLYRANPLCQIPVEFTGDAWLEAIALRPAQELVAALEAEWQDEWDEWERALPTWTCACGSTFKQSESQGHTVLHRIDSRLLGAVVGSVGARGYGGERNGRCPDCRRDFAETITRHHDPQMLLFDQPPDG